MGFKGGAFRKRGMGPDPRDIAGLISWIRAEPGRDLSAAKVTTWRDEMANRSYSQGTDANRFTYVGGSINGWGICRGGDSLFMDCTAFAQTGDCTIFVVMRQTALAGAQVFDDDSSGNTGGVAYPLPALGTGTNNNTPTMFVNNGGGNAVWGSALTAGVAYCVRHAWEYVATNTLHVQVGASTEVAGTTTDEALRNWNRIGNASSPAFRGDVAERAMYNRKLSAAECQIYRDYANRRYAVAM